MGLFKKRKNENRNLKDDSGAALLNAILNSPKITADKAIQIPAFSACINLTASLIAMLPIKLYEENGKETNEITDDIRTKLLNDETGDLLDSFQMKKAWLTDYLMYGSAYIYINKNRNTVESLHYVKHDSVCYEMNSDPIFKNVMYRVNGKQYRDFEFIKLLRKTQNGVYGIGILEENDLILQVAYMSMLFEKSQTEKGGARKGFLLAERTVSQESMNKLKEAWRDVFSNNGESVLVLNNGLKFQEASSNPTELQLNEQKRTNDDLVHSIFNLSPKITSGTATDDEFANTAKTTFLPIIYEIQTALNKELLLEVEKGKKYFAIDTSELLKGDILKRYQAYQIGLSQNFLQPDEVRYKEDLKPLNFNYIKLGLQDVLLDPKTGRIYTPNTNSFANFNDKSLQNQNDINLQTDGEERKMKPQVFIVYGSPASGKTTYVLKNKKPNDMVIDLDCLKYAISLNKDFPTNLLGTAINIRDFLYELIKKHKVSCENVWIISCLPKKFEREKIRKELNAKLIFIDTPYEECLNRAKNDPKRQDKELQIKIIDDFFRNFELQNDDNSDIIKTEQRFNPYHDEKGRFAESDIFSDSFANTNEKGISGKKHTKNSTNTVNLDYINSQEYHNKFKNLTGNLKVDESIYSQCKAVLTHRNGTDKEDMCLIDSITGKIAGMQSNSKSDFQVEYNDSLKNAIKNYKPYTLISIHNHPTNNPPTGSDFVSAGSKKYKMGIIPTHDGKVFSYKAGNKPFNSTFFGNIVDKHRHEGYNEYSAIIKTLQEYEKSYGISWEELL